jgi:hypothetical protein
MSGGGEASALQQSGESADQELSDQPPDSSSTTCESQHDWIEVQLVGEDGRGVPGQRLRVTLPDGSIREETLDAEGVAGFDGIASGTCTITFPDLDQDAWEPFEEQTSAAKPESGSAAPPAAAGTVEPVGQGDRVVGETDCVASIADETGHFWQTIWNDPANADLKAARQDPNLLLPGDRVTVPPLREGSAERPTGERHRFRRRGVPSRLTVRVLENGKPRAGEPYKLMADETVRSGVTGDDGSVSTFLSALARKVELRVGAGDALTVYDLSPKELRPLNDLAGAQQRLSNLGFECLEEKGRFGDTTRAAVTDFQKSRKLAETGELDAATLEALRKGYGS